MSVVDGQSRSGRVLHSASLVGILLVAALLRAWGPASGQLLWHPDEIFMVLYPLNLFSGDLNPRLFYYPSWHFYELGLLYGADFLWHRAVDGVGLFDWIARHYFVDATPLRDLARGLAVLYGVGTVLLAGAIAGRLAGRGAGDPHRAWGDLLSSPALLAAATLAVNSVHVRQSPLATVDTPLAFWFAAATLAALRLLDTARRRDYLLAGVLVGIAAATKYPGAAAGAAVLAAHLLARRSPLDARLWLAGLSAVIAFGCLSPYVLLDASTFLEHFRFQVAHVEAGRFGDAPAPWATLVHGLRVGLGTPAWLLWLAVSAWALWRRRAAHAVVLATFVAGYLAVSWGDLSFLRYLLPLLPLQAALVGDGLARLGAWLAGQVSQRRARFTALGSDAQRRGAVTMLATSLLLVAPARAALGVAALSARTDTRTLAREWIESHVPSGTSICNFGGWPGDVPLRTYEDQWWRLRTFQAAWPAGSQAHLARALAAVDPGVPFYSQAVRNDNRDVETGSVELIHQRQCALVVTHEHPLPYSAIDADVARRLPEEATRVARFDPQLDPDLDVRADFDADDAYYLPLHGRGAHRPGPRIDIWEVDAYRAEPRPTSMRHVFSRVLSLMASNAVLAADAPAAAEALRAATAFHPDNRHALLVAAHLHRELGDTTSARTTFEQLLAREPASSTAREGLATLAAARGDYAEAAQRMAEVCRLRPRDEAAARQWQLWQQRAADVSSARDAD